MRDLNQISSTSLNNSAHDSNIHSRIDETSASVSSSDETISELSGQIIPPTLTTTNIEESIPEGTYQILINTPHPLGFQVNDTVIEVTDRDILEVGLNEEVHITNLPKAYQQQIIKSAGKVVALIAFGGTAAYTAMPYVLALVPGDELSDIIKWGAGTIGVSGVAYKSGAAEAGVNIVVYTAEKTTQLTLKTVDFTYNRIVKPIVTKTVAATVKSAEMVYSSVSWLANKFVSEATEGAVAGDRSLLQIAKLVDNSAEIGIFVLRGIQKASRENPKFVAVSLITAVGLTGVDLLS